MTSPNIGEVLTKPTTFRTDDWSEIEALLQAPGQVPPTSPGAPPKRRLPRLLLGLITLAALGGGGAVLKAAITPGCRGGTCESRLETAVQTPLAIRDVTVDPRAVALAAEPLATPQPTLQGRSVSTLPALPAARAPRSRRHVAPRSIVMPHPTPVAAKTPAHLRAAARVAAPAPPRRPVRAQIARAPALQPADAAPPMTARHPMRAVAARSARLQRIMLSPSRYILVERR